MGGTVSHTPLVRIDRTDGIDPSSPSASRLRPGGVMPFPAQRTGRDLVRTCRVTPSRVYKGSAKFNLVCVSPGGLETGRSVGAPEAAVRGPGGSVGRVTPGRSVGRTPRHLSKSGRKVDSRPRMHIPNVKNDWRSHLIPRNCSKTRKNDESRKIFAAPTARRVGRSATAGLRAAPRLGRSVGDPRVGNADFWEAGSVGG